MAQIQVGDVVRIPPGSFISKDDWRKSYEGKCAVVAHVVGVTSFGANALMVHPLIPILKKDITVPVSGVRAKSVPVDQLSDDELAALMIWRLKGG